MNFGRWIAGVVGIVAVVVVLLLLIGRIVGPRPPPWTRESAGVTLARRADSDTATLWREIDAYVEREMRGVRAPGLGLVVVRDTTVIHERGFGVADPSGRAVTAETPFIIGSLTKAITATAVIQLAEAGFVDLDAPVRRYLPWFRTRDTAASNRISVRELLNHTSGIPESEGMLLVRASRAITDAQDQSLIQGVRLQHSPGEAFEYSNANYWLLGLIVEAVAREPYESYVRRAILDPLQMRHTYASEADAEVHGLAAGYRVWFGLPRVERLPYYARELAVGYLISTPRDMGRFLSANLGYNPLVISERARDLLHTPPPGSPYAMGWLTDSIGGNSILWHTGAVANYHCDMLLIPDKHMGVVAMSNVNNILFEHRYSQAIKGVAALLLGFYPPPLHDLRYRVTYWLITLAAGLWLVWRAGQIVAAWRSRHRHDTRAPSHGGLHLARSLVDPGLSVGVVIGLRLVLQTPFSTLRWFVPDLTIFLLANLAVSVALALWSEMRHPTRPTIVP